MKKTIEIDGGFSVEIDKRRKIATVTKFSSTQTNVFIPRSVILGPIEYKITKIGTKAFQSCKIESLTFPEDSEVTTFESDCFLYAKINKIQIPPKLAYLGDCWHRYFHFNEVEISPQNKLFLYENGFLLKKKKEEDEEYDQLILASEDLEEVNVPDKVKVIVTEAFYGHEKTKAVIFSENSKLEKLESRVFIYSGIQKLTLPPKFKYYSRFTFDSANKLIDLQISPKNEFFKIIDEKLLVGKDVIETDTTFNKLIFCCRNVESVNIPPEIKIIEDYAFCNCYNLKSLLVRIHHLR